MVKKPRLLYLAAGAAVIGICTFATLGGAEARPQNGKHQHFKPFKHRFYAERHIYVVPVVRPRVVQTVAATVPIKWAKKCGSIPEEA